MPKKKKRKIKQKTGGTKLDQGKNQLDLLSPIWIFGVGRVLTFGAFKYARWNWEKGILQSRLIAATLRHIFAYMGGEDDDAETGECHLYSASCCLMFLCHLRITRPDLDDRNKIKIKKQ